jgi:hypothetical protein
LPRDERDTRARASLGRFEHFPRAAEIGEERIDL